MKLRIGIDPGCTGAIVTLGEDMRLLEWMLMPTVKVGTNTRVNGAALAAFLRNAVGIAGLAGSSAHAYIELVSAMPGNGGASMFTFGHAAGIAEGQLQGLGIPYTLVLPPKWKKRAGLIGKDKDASRSRAIQLWPEWRELDAKEKGKALGEAALIARFGSEGEA